MNMRHHRLLAVRKLRNRIHSKAPVGATVAKTIVAIRDHELIKPFGADHAADIGEPHTAAQLEKWFNTNHKCIHCNRIIRTSDELKSICKVKDDLNGENN